MRKVMIGITPLLLSLVACAQTPKPSISQSTTTPSTGTQAAPASSATSANKTTATGTTAAAATDPPPPAHPITDVQVKELMELTGTDKLKEQLTEYIIRNIHQSPFMPADVIDDMKTSLAKIDVNTGATAAYKRYLSTEDAATIIAFYKTPAGHDLVKANPHLMADVQRSAMQSGQQVAKEVIDRHRPEIEAAQKAYQQQHATPGAGTLGPTLGPTPGATAPAPKPTTPPAATPATKPTTPPSQ